MSLFKYKNPETGEWQSASVIRGDPGKTAYEYAQDAGYTGTEAEFSEKLAAEVPTKTSQLTNDRGFITGYTETDPTVPAWAKASTKPTYTANEIIDSVSKSEAFDVRHTVSPDYTNVVSTSVDENGDIFNGSGWMANKQVGSDGSIKDATGTYVTGFIPVKLGDVIRIKDPGRTPFSTGCTFALYK